MTERPVYLPDYMSLSAPVEWHEEPAKVITLPVIRIERAPDGNPRKYPDEIPSDVEP